MAIPFIEGKEDLEIKVKCGLTFSVPNDISLITPYVLLEQEDWFELEAPFVRSLLKEGMNVLDIGTNYGLYGLCAAKQVGPGGKVYCFEPSIVCTRHLNKTIAANKLANVEIIQKGLSNFVGTTSFRVEDNTELNQFVDSPAGDANVEIIEVTTLDVSDEELGWPEIDFVKMDAEGQEKNILEAGERFFLKHSPLVMYELKHGTDINTDLIEAFEAIGYRNYRLVPGARVLIPFNKNERIDGFQLNLFACNASRSRQLKEMGLLIESFDSAQDKPAGEDYWREYFDAFPYAAMLQPHWDKYIAAKGTEDSWANMKAALNAFASYKRTEANPELAVSSLFKSLEILLQEADQRPGFAILMSLSRVALEAGEQELALTALSNLYEALSGGASMGVFQPFLLPLARYDKIDPVDKLESWIMSSIVEAREKYSSFSSYYTAGSTYPELKQLTESRLCSGEMIRRRSLMELASGKHEKEKVVERVNRFDNESKNSALWQAILS